MSIIESLHCMSSIDCLITPHVIQSCMLKLNRDKSDGNLGFNSNHLINGGHRLHVMLSMLFNSMLVHGYYPSILLKSTIISIPKDRTASLSDSNNYRGISLFNSISKLYDYVMIELCGDELMSSDMQFAYKSNHSTTLCTDIFKEVIDCYIRGNSNVYCCLLDASKAFDKVHYGKLFNVLLEKSISPLIIRLIVNSYLRQESRASWGSHMSNYFSLLNGVKQGGVISAILFTLYIDGLLLRLKESGYGCHINGTFMGALSYADDITLISPSIIGLNKMIAICSKFADDYSITFNSKKSVCIKFGDTIKEHEKVTLKNSEIAWVSKIKHLGNFIDTSLTDEIDCRMKISSFIGQVNKLNANFGHLQTHVLSRLFKLYCCSYYGSQIWCLNSLYFDKVCTAWNKGVRRVLNLPYNAHTWVLGPLLHQCHLRYQLQRRTIRFIDSLSTSVNEIVKICYHRATCNANSPIGSNLSFIRNYYGSTMPHALKLSAQNRQLVKEIESLLLARNGIYSLDGFSNTDINALITLMATQ